MPNRKHAHPRASRCAADARKLPGDFKFEFKCWHHNISDKDLIADLRQVARQMGVRTLTTSEYRSQSKFSPATLTNRFGSWNKSLKKAGLELSKNHNVPPDLVVADIRRVARKLKTTSLGNRQYLAVGKFSRSLILRCFASWELAVHAAGLEAMRLYRISDNALFENLEHLWRMLGRQPTCLELSRPMSKFSSSPYTNRFGGMQKAARAFIKWKARNPHHKSAAAAQRPLRGAAIPRHKTGRSVSVQLRYRILRRDKFKCRACGRSPATHHNVDLEVDHIVPWSAGGETVVKNLQALCQKCNRGKSNL
jgi:hypothetical protein